MLFQLLSELKFLTKLMGKDNAVGGIDADINISQSSVATDLRCGGIFNKFYCKFLEIATLKKLKIGELGEIVWCLLF